MKRNHFALIMILAAAFLVPAVGLGQKAKAKKFFDKGVEAMDDHDYKTALENFEGAYEAAPHWMVLAHIGNCHAKLNSPVQAIAAYEKYLKDGGEDIPEEERAAVRENLKEQRKKVGVLHLMVKPKTAEVRIDGDDYGSPPFEEILLKAGPHSILVIRGDDEEVKDISIYSGKEKTVRMYPNDDSVAAVISTPSPATPEPEAEPEPEPEPEIEPAAEPEPEPEPEPTPDGVLMVGSNVDGSSVTLDGDEKGSTPYEETIPAGAYQLDVGAEGYQAYSDGITITGGMVNTFNINLVSVDEKPERLNIGFWISGGVAIAGLGLGIAGWAVFGTNNASEQNFADRLSDPMFDSFSWSEDCAPGTVLEANSPHEYYCTNEWERRDYADKAKLGLGLGIAGTAIFAVGGTMAALFFFKPEWFFGADSDAELVLTPIATGDSRGLMLAGRF